MAEWLGGVSEAPGMRPFSPPLSPRQFPSESLRQRYIEVSVAATLCDACKNMHATNMGTVQPP